MPLSAFNRRSQGLFLFQPVFPILRGIAGYRSKSKSCRGIMGESGGNPPMPLRAPEPFLHWANHRVGTDFALYQRDVRAGVFEHFYNHSNRLDFCELPALSLNLIRNYSATGSPPASDSDFSNTTGISLTVIQPSGVSFWMLNQTLPGSGTSISGFTM